MDFYEATDYLEEGFCLWVGAGLTRQITGGRASVPLWADLTRELERKAGLPVRNDPKYPDRLEACRDKLGDKAFSAFLREKYYTELCFALLTYAAELADTKDFIPEEVRQVSALGQLANPIVSFNIEPLSSLLLARPGGPIRIIPYVHPKKERVLATREPHERFQRIVYHPHGLITGTCVMTKSQYEDKDETLAFGLAIHAAFGNNLAIVGMSLQDEYLRRQIESSRRQIKKVVWFDSHHDEALLTWAHKQCIFAVQVDWRTFWSQWTTRGIAVDEAGLYTAWSRALEEAATEVEGGELDSLSRSLAKHDPELAERMKRLGEESWEPGTSRHIHGKSAYEIARKVRARLVTAGIPLPSIIHTI